jgi:drug/metabolite transporter (DMT)-like permease
VSQAVALLLLVPVALAVGSVPASPWHGLVAGLVGAAGLGAFYAALAAGTMGVVAPVAATGAALPVVVGLLRGESPGVLQLVGMVLVLAGVVLASGPELSGGTSARPLLLAVGAAASFGTVIVLLADGSRGRAGSVVVTLLLMRVASVGVVGPLLVVRMSAQGRRELRPALPVLAAVGAVDVTANTCFAYASRGGLLSVVAVLSSLYPVVTVLLARQLHRERLLPVQAAGALGTLLGVALLSAG